MRPMGLLNNLRLDLDRMGDDREPSGESSASQQNSDPYLTLEEAVNDLKKRVEDLEDKGVNTHLLPPLSHNADINDIIAHINYIVTTMNRGVSNGAHGNSR